MLRISLFFLLFIFLIFILVIYAFLLPRPLDTTDPSIFLKDGKALNYCDLPKLDGSGKSADDIPKAFTPGCGLTSIPLPILYECRATSRRSDRYERIMAAIRNRLFFREN